MNEQRNNNGRGIFYGVIGVATLVVAIIGATFAYFTATANAINNITGNMATITFSLDVHKVTTADEVLGGMIPMSNTMVESAVASKSDEHAGEVSGETTVKPQICVDDNGNAVCQIYKVIVKNTGSAGVFVDGYISLTGGSKEPTDAGSSATNKTSMRWAQVFCTGTDNKLTSCTTAGTTTTEAGGVLAWSALDGISDTTGHYNTMILVSNSLGTSANYAKLADNITPIASSATFGTGTTTYDIISTNYIRISDHNSTGENATVYSRDADMTSALVLNQNILANAGSTVTTSTGSSANATMVDAKVYYIVVWLSETGTNQTVGATGAAESATNFFRGSVVFNSSQGSEVTATFGGYTAVQSDTVSGSGS